MNSYRCNTVLIEAIAVRLRVIRESLGYSQIDVYMDTDIHVARIEAGKINISVSTLSDLCVYYDVPLEELFKDIPIK